jgi:teichuronic acid biosynthesis glycosyltransferase TuaG
MERASIGDVTVIVPAYNSAEWLGQTLASIQAQTHRSWQMIVADDASTDSTAQIVAMHARDDARIRYLRMPANTGGPAAPRNAAVAESTTSWVAFCDADDLWHPRKLEVQLALAQETGADIVCSRIRDFRNPAGPGVPLDDFHDAPHERIGLWRLLAKNVIPCSSVVCRRSLVVRVGGFDISKGLVAVEDYDLWLRLLEQGAQAVKVTVPLVAYRRLPGSLSASKLKLARRVWTVLGRHFARTGRSLLFPIVGPALMLSYACQAVYLRLGRKRL